MPRQLDQVAMVITAPAHLKPGWNNTQSIRIGCRKPMYNMTSGSVPAQQAHTDDGFLRTVSYDHENAEHGAGVDGVS